MAIDLPFQPRSASLNPSSGGHGGRRIPALKTLDNGPWLIDISRLNHVQPIRSDCLLGIFRDGRDGRFSKFPQTASLPRRVFPRRQPIALVRDRLFHCGGRDQFRAICRRSGLRLQARHARGQLGMAGFPRPVDSFVDFRTPLCPRPHYHDAGVFGTPFWGPGADSVRLSHHRQLCLGQFRARVLYRRFRPREDVGASTNWRRSGGWRSSPALTPCMAA